MLFVGVKDSNPVGSKASLAELFFDKLNYGIRKIEEGNYYIENRTLYLSIIVADAKMSLQMCILKEETLVVV